MPRYTVEELQERLSSFGQTLTRPPSSPDKLITTLDGTEHYLSKVEQSPPASIADVLSSLIKALASDKLLKHSDLDVRVGVAACISEITRITAPEAPYDDDKMKDVFQLIVSSVENISDTSSISYVKRVSILETVAKVRSCVIMLDLDCDQMVIDMFQHFLRDIRDYHAENVFNAMETIMTLLLEESEDSSPNMLYPILSALEKNNKTVLPVAKKLAERVIQSSANKLRTCLPQALKALNANVKDYSEVLASVCQGSVSNVLNCEPEIKESIEETATNCANEPETEVTSANGGNEEETDETATNGGNEEETDETATNGGNEEETDGIAANDANELETAANGATDAEPEETAANGANEPKTEETATNDANESEAETAANGANGPETEETVTNDANETEAETAANGANEPETEETATNDENESEAETATTGAKEPEAADSVVDANCSKEDSDIVSDANLVSEEPATLEAKVDQVAKENGRQSNPDNDSAESPDALDNEKQSEQVNTGDDIPTSPNEVLPVDESAVSSENVKDNSMQLSPSEPHENEDVNVSTPMQGGSLPEPNQVKKSARTKRKGKSAKKQKRTGKKQPAKKVVKNEEDEFKKDDDNAPGDSDTKSLEETEKTMLSDEDGNSGAKEQKDSGEKLCTEKTEKKSTSTESSKSKNDGGNASESETNLLDKKLKVPDDENNLVAKLQKGTGKKQPAKKAKVDSTLVEEDEFKNDIGNASDSEAISLDKTLNLKVSDEENLPVVKKQRSSKKQPVKKAKKIVELIEENESENNGADSGMLDSSPVRKVGKRSAVKPSSEKDGSKSSVREDDGEDMVTSPRSPRSTRDGSNKEKSSRMSSKRKRTPGTEKASGTVEYGEDLVGSKVEVWWPQDKLFYPGVIHSFDSVKRRHTVLYADGDEEHLNLKRQKWQFVEDEPVSDAAEAVEDSSDDASPDVKRKKGANYEASSKHKSKDSAKSTGKSKSKDVAKTPYSSKQDSQKTAKSKAKTPQTATGSSKSGSSKAKANEKEIGKGKSLDTSKSRTSDAKSGKKRRR